MAALEKLWQGLWTISKKVIQYGHYTSKAPNPSPVYVQHSYYMRMLRQQVNINVFKY